MSALISTERGCGFRKAGGVYLETPLSAGGRPVEDFLLCPPIRLPRNEQGEMVVMGDDGPVTITPRGVRLIRKGSAYHVLDFVGSENYPNAWDFIAETQLLGISRRCELSKAQYSLLTVGSRLMLIHAAGWLLNHAAYRAPMSIPESEWFGCPKGLHKVDDIAARMCVGLYRHDLEQLDHRMPERDLDRAAGLRKLACGAAYFAYERSRLIVRESEPAIFAAFPIGQISVVRDTSEHRAHGAKLEKLTQTGLPVHLVEE